MDLSEVQKMSICEIHREFDRLIAGGPCYDVFDLDEINHYVLSKDGPFQVAFVNNLYTVIGHHDHMEVEAVLATARLRAEALLLTLKNFQK